MSTSKQLDEATLRRIVDDVVRQIGGNGSGHNPGGASRTDRGATVAPTPPSRIHGEGRDGVFSCAGEACAAAHEAYRKLTDAGLAARRKVVEIVKTLCEENAQAWGKLELDETKIGRPDHKVEKLQIVKLCPGVEWIRPMGMSGDNGITMEEYCPFGVVGAVTPSTHSSPTLAGNVISIVAAGNTLVINPHPGAARCAVESVRAFNRAIVRETGTPNIVTIIAEPSLESFGAIAESEHVELMCITGGPGVVQAALKSGKRSICAGPGNPPVVIDETADLNKAAEQIIQGAAYDNNLLCIGEKEVFVVEPVADAFIDAMRRAGAFRLNEAQTEQLAATVFTSKEGAGCAAPVLNRDYIGRDPQVLADVAGVKLPPETELLFAETPADHLFVEEEQMMPFLPIVRVRDFEEGVAEAKKAEHGYRHSAMIHSRLVDRMTHMARELVPTLFVKNGPCVAGLGMGGEGYLSYSIATTTGEGITTPQTFTRTRRCVMVDNLKIY